MDATRRKTASNRLMVLTGNEDRYRQMEDVLQREHCPENDAFVLDHCHQFDEALQQLSLQEYRACFVDEASCRGLACGRESWGAVLARKLNERFITTTMVLLLDSDHFTIGPKEAACFETGRIRLLPTNRPTWQDIQGAIADLLRPTARVLLVHPGLQEASRIAGMLQKFPDYDFVVDWAVGCDMAIEKLRACRHDLLIVNHDLGDDSGSAMFSLLEILNARLPVILCMGSSAIELDELALRMVGRRQAHVISFRRAVRQPGALARLCIAQLRKH